MRLVSGVRLFGPCYISHGGTIIHRVVSVWVGLSVDRTVGETAKKILMLEKDEVSWFVDDSDQCKTSAQAVGSSNKVKFDQNTIKDSYA